MILHIRQILGSSELRGIPLTHTSFHHEDHIFFQIHGIRKCYRNIKYSRAALGSNFEIRVVSWRAIFCQFQVRSRASYWNFCLGYIEYFFIGWTVLFTANPDDILSLTQPQISATWRPWRFAFKWSLTLRFLSALFYALLPIFLLSFDLNLSFFRCSWLLVALWRVLRKHITRLQTTKVAGHPEAQLC